MAGGVREEKKKGKRERHTGSSSKNERGERLAILISVCVQITNRWNFVWDPVIFHFAPTGLPISTME